MSEVLIIGGGVIGCAIAHRLSVRGWAVTVLDPRTPGRGASRASAGMLAPFTEGRHDAALQRLGALSLSRYDDLAAELAADGARVPYQRDGSLEVALDPGALGVLEETAAALVAEGVAHQRLDAAALHALEPALTPGALAGLHLPAHGAVDVPALVDALWESALRRGARLHRAGAVSVAARAGALEVESSDGPIVAKHVVLAAGCWSGQVGLDGLTPVPVEPVRGQLVLVKTDRPLLTHAIWGPGCYLVPWPDGSTMIGATVERVGFDERSTVEGVHYLLAAATELVPALADATFAEVRVGLRPGTPDGRPVLGRSQGLPGLIYAAGHYRNGALLAPATADAVAGLLDGTPLEPIWHPCDPLRLGLS